MTVLTIPKPTRAFGASSPSGVSDESDEPGAPADASQLTGTQVPSTQSRRNVLAAFGTAVGGAFVTRRSSVQTTVTGGSDTATTELTEDLMAATDVKEGETEGAMEATELTEATEAIQATEAVDAEPAGERGPGAITADAAAQADQRRAAVFSGKKAQIRLSPAKAPTHPTSGHMGDLFVDSTGRLWFCRAGGKNATWKQVKLV